jgi:HK97 family phage major capsid protein
VTVRDKDRAAFREALDEAKAIVEGAKAEDRDLTSEEKSEVDTLTATAEAAKARIETDVKDDTLAIRLAALMGGDGAKSDEATPEPKSLGESFTESPAFKAWLEQNARGGELPESLKNFRTPSVEVGRKLFTLAELGSPSGAFDTTDRRGVLVPHAWPQGAAELLALLSTGTTGGSLVHYAIETWTNAADFVAEATDLATGAKPESDATYTPATVPVSTIAHWVAATKWALADVGQLRALIDNGLTRGIGAKVAAAVLVGDGVAPEWFGLNNLVSIPAQAYATSPLATIRAGLLAVENAGYNPNGVVMNPADWAAIDASTPHVVTDPLTARAKQINGVQVTTLASQPVGFAMLGDFKQAYLLDREQTTITATDSHADFFIKNLVAILGEARAAFFVAAPAALRKADLTA